MERNHIPSHNLACLVIELPVHLSVIGLRAKTIISVVVARIHLLQQYHLPSQRLILNRQPIEIDTRSDRLTVIVDTTPLV